MPSLLSALYLILSAYLIPLCLSHPNTCRSYCGNITIDYPFALQYGCGHPGFRDLLFCMNDVLMFHVSSGSYRVLEIDYAYQALTLHEPHMSTCDNLVLGTRGNGFSVEPWRAPYMNPAADNVFMLIACSPRSPLFQGFPGKHLPCRNVSGMGCEDYYACPAWEMLGHKRLGSASFFGSGPPECCAVPYEAIRGINLTKLECEGYSSAYSVAPLKVDGPGGWSYGIRVRYSVQGNDEFCGACEATAGTCGYGSDGIRQVCMCGDFNSTSNCDSVGVSSGARVICTRVKIFSGLLTYVLAWVTTNQISKVWYIM
ncbi:hypothetical protein AAZX31_05G037300 [Glycine max]|uniref:Wall-associated receptor kinase galacturonan-binding domain-containing protein n=2 Tax=Glycine subgen. Soja TaxID=1462606 RepID=K7KMR5_SOYBN|nr:uncharacterized protein LOC100818252 isoform X2 [Glycine max]XP_028231528.1 uncharacterized protein LOC114411974 [Glycine soja]KAG5056724.1 hypothetical protein JHK86_011720 [Glycine max]KAG5153762.1 hypothetical protein JHK82_011731 [Glycine max]KAH1132698.1 hypothetical protein GYH30_011505 [Glycine max]KAH1248804.1 hypothetical protein GmHk_05G012324 [Glycine max]KRH57092.1 hypothetical protein GLYMA_05G039000v4 [Glycine max]|eukprot:XP_006579571.1 uncharacterized protein LOC100818252 isoform X2 [Glycine max]